MKKLFIIIGVILFYSVISTGCSSSSGDMNEAVTIYEEMLDVAVQSQQEDADQDELQVKQAELGRELIAFGSKMDEKYKDDEKGYDDFKAEFLKKSEEIRQKYMDKYPDLDIPGL